MEHYLSLFVRSIFIDNMALSFFLGMCTFLALSKKMNAALGLSVAVTVVLTITVPPQQPYLYLPAARRAMAWAGLPDLDLSFSGPDFLHRCNRRCGADPGDVSRQVRAGPLQRPGVFLPLITVNCAIMGAALFMVERDYNFGESVVFGAGSGIGWAGDRRPGGHPRKAEVLGRARRPAGPGNHVHDGGPHGARLHVLRRHRHLGGIELIWI